MLIDLRSDTVTHPSPAMREAMYRAEVGDDVYGEDPTLNHLQEMAAQRLGKDAALFVPSGTMGNATAILTHTGRGQAVIVGDQSHIYHYEAGGPSTLGGAPMVTLPTLPDGMLDLTSLQNSIADESDEHVAATGLICIENTHNRCGGTVLNVAQVEAITSLAHAQNIPVHMDGARLFNAAIALNIPVNTLVHSVDSVTFCLSKGLCAPIGSLLVGNTEFIRRARRVRKLLGGGMRQVGILAAAGIVALDQMVERLAEDHANCQLLAQGLADFPQIQIQPERVVTNILIFTLQHEQSRALSQAETLLFIANAQQQGILLSHMGGNLIRAVTHYGLEQAHIQTALTGIRRALIEMQL